MREKRRDQRIEQGRGDIRGETKEIATERSEEREREL